jgi:hypothetical protein
MVFQFRQVTNFLLLRKIPLSVRPYTTESLSRLHVTVGQFVVPDFVMAFPVDRNLLR